MIATIGTFDGVHLGHQYLLHELVAKASERQTKSLVVTFNPHPKAVIDPDRAPRILTTLRQRVELIRDAGVDFVHVVTFNEDIRRMSAVEFVGKLRTIYTDLDSVIFGFNNTIGSDRNSGEPDVSSGLKKMGIEVLSRGEAPVHANSTAIRRHLENGRVVDANALLGRHYSLRGKVVEGYGIGHTLGFPT
ncbi:MAG: adenylyltransferase/cytidyltransferase family protein, partial [Muribaculaceae bacterium]|nr:adenylyltransferase/cytidyltransferase family protein [Muribaculaceae bacterium]